jgi:hypothetical protein
MVPSLDSPASLALKHTTRDAAILKQMVDILELQLVCFREEGIYDRDPAEAEDGEDDERAPLWMC